MDAIILVGGRGTRLQNTVPGLPKALAPVNGVPFLDILMNQMNRCKSIHRVILAVGYRHEMIEQRYRNATDYQFEIEFSRETTLLGTGGAIKKALAYTHADNVIVQNGDTFVDIDYQHLIEHHLYSGVPLTVVLRMTEDTGRYGRVEVDEEHIITAFREKASAAGLGFINSGIYVLQRQLFDEVPEDAIISVEEDLLPEFIKKKAFAYITEGKFIDIGTPETYRQTGEYLKEA